MKPNMKKKFDFSEEMSEAEAIKATPKNEYLEEEKRLLDINAKELASLNDMQKTEQTVTAKTAMLLQFRRGKVNVFFLNYHLLR